MLCNPAALVKRSAIFHLGSLLIVSAIAAGCASSSPGRVETTPESEPWFCQMNQRGDDWDCVQSEALARAPRPARLPRPDGADDVRDAPPVPDPTDTAEAAGAAELPEPPAPEPPADADGLISSDVLLKASAGAALALEPETLLDLPEDYFAVQIVAMSRASQIKDFIADRGLENVVSVRIGRDDTIMHVLLLGVFGTYDEAERAILERPGSLADVDLWIRPLGSLQQAMLRGEAIAASLN